MDYEVLRIIWWALLGVLLIGFAIMDGFDIGAAILLPFVGKKDHERRIIINTFAPVWEGNQVWLILGAGAIFAAWPFVYAVAFSGLYIAMFLALLGLIARPVALKFRGKSEHPTWRSIFDGAICISSFVPALIFGVGVGNALIGVPFHFDDTLRMTYTGTFWQLLNPYSVVCGIVSVCMMIMQGAVYLLLKTEDIHIGARARTALFGSIGVLLILFTLHGIWTLFFLKGYSIVDGALPNGPSNPLMKSVTTQSWGSYGYWAKNYVLSPFTILAPILVYLCAILTVYCVRVQKLGIAFITSSITTASVIATVGLTMFPFLLPSSSHPNSSLTVWDASSSKGTLLIMLIAAVIFVPIILSYTSWVYRVLRGKVTQNTVDSNQNSY